MIETEYILTLWLKIVPELTVIFVRLTLISVMVNILGNSCYTAVSYTHLDVYKRQVYGNAW